MTIQSRLKALEAKAEASRPVLPVPMTDEDFIPHGFAGRQIVATLHMLDIVKEMVSDDAELMSTTDKQIAYLRCREVNISDRIKASREISEDIGEAMGIDQFQTMPPEVFKEMCDSCHENRLPRHVEVAACN